MTKIWDISKIIRDQFPNSILGEIKTEQPITESFDYQYKTIQTVEIDDPRDHIHCMSGNERQTVQIQRILKKIPTNLPIDKCFHLEPQIIIEIIKEYSFEEWDKGLENKF
jgi:ABC-type lipopolysaccharide export system ATPase subunit